MLNSCSSVHVKSQSCIVLFDLLLQQLYGILGQPSYISYCCITHLVNSHKISVLQCSLARLVQAMGIVSLYLMVLRHVLFANSIFNVIMRDY